MNPWKIPQQSEPKQQQKNKKQKKHLSEKENGQKALKKFEEAHSKNVEKAKAYTEQIDSSSEEEEDLNSNDILDNLVRSYSGGTDCLLKTQSFLENFLQAASVVCLICIGTIRRIEAIWSCQNCYCFFHLQCIRRWGNDSISQQKLRSTDEQGYYNNLGEYIPKKLKSIQWCCPKCRKEYSPENIPRIYTCFCEKAVNPPFHPWILPHSCGEICEKYLVPDCGHQCVLLCHPGPCPPCPQTISISCKCRQSSPKSIRCFTKSWTCDRKCQKLLSCGIHKCNQECHEEGKCPPCIKKSKQICKCGAETSERNCSERSWQCKKVCNKTLSCGLHKCRKVCHDGVCGDCPMGLPRACPCGKNKTVAPCTENVGTCGDTCQKQLACGLHHCALRCHKGECSPCLTIIEKKCRCGLHSKEQPCSRIYTCETKCKQMRDCGRHLCNKKCCDGQCPPCDKICSKLLSCKKHKCKSVCHDGPCYPCELKAQVKCRCGLAVIIVPCGREKKTRPPRCNQPCRIPSRCHHQNPHRCHWNACPPCTQICNLKNDVTNCEHPCQARCHVAITPFTLTNQKIEMKGGLPHPWKCEVQVQVTCIGGHETVMLPCWMSKPQSCQRDCGRSLKCGNHSCPAVCHSVPDVNNKNEQEGCKSCEKGCEIPRPSGCTHPCKKPCHLPPCEPCSTTTRTKCHCGLNQVYYKCEDYFRKDMDETHLHLHQENLKSCGNRCIKNYPCGHRCTSICHPGKCPDPEKCKKKVKVYCECRNLKAEISCEKFRNGIEVLPCDSNCEGKKEMEERIKREEEEKQQKDEEERNRLELEKFEKKFGKKKPRERRLRENVEEKGNHLWTWLACAVAVLLIAIVFYVFYY